MADKRDRAVYTVEDIRQILNLGRTGTYEFVNKVFKDQKPFRVLKIGRQLRIPKAEFDRWLYGDETKEIAV